MSTDEAAGDRDLLFARFYDLEYRDYQEDVNFYLQYALALDPEMRIPILELGCGTGRILLSLAERGFGVTGVDISPGMLAVCASRAEELGVRRPVSLVQGRIQQPGSLPGSPFGMAYCALNTFAYLTNTQDQLQALSSVHSALADAGVLIIDLTPPLAHLLPPSGNELIHQGSYHDPENNQLVHKFVTGFHRPAEQLHHVRLLYDVEGPDGSLRRFSREDIFRWTGRYEMQLLLERAGFRLDNLYGSYDLDEYADESERMIFVAHKA